MPKIKEKVQPVTYEIRRSERARRSRIVVTSDKVEVVAPLRMSERKIKQFVNDNYLWICNKKTELEARAKLMASRNPWPEEVVTGARILYRGSEYVIEVRYSDEITPIVEMVSGDGGQEESESNQIIVLLPEHSAESEAEEALINWLQQQAMGQLRYFVQKHQNRFGLIPRGLRIKQQKSRWGSCGADDSINLNWQLIFYPDAVFEYVVVHELCHIEHKNHSRKFWRLVAAHLPYYREQYDWLKKNAQIVEI